MDKNERIWQTLLRLHRDAERVDEMFQGKSKTPKTFEQRLTQADKKLLKEMLVGL